MIRKLLQGHILMCWLGKPWMRPLCSRTWQSNQAWAQQPASWRLAPPYRLLRHLLGRPPSSRECCGCTVAVNPSLTLACGVSRPCQQQVIWLSQSWPLQDQPAAVATLHQLMSPCHALCVSHAASERHAAGHPSTSDAQSGTSLAAWQTT